MPKGLKPVRRKLASGEVRVHWYHRATGKALKHDPTTTEGLLEVQGLDGRAQAVEAAEKAASGTYAALWLSYRQSEEWRALRPRTRSDYQAVRDWLGGAAEKKPLATLTPADVYQLRDKAAKEKGRRFGNYVVQVLRLTLGWGKERGLVRGDNPARAVKLKRKPAGAPKVNRAWRLEEVEAFAADCPFQLMVPFALGLFAGMRQGDALMATWSAYAHNQGRIAWTASKNGEDCGADVEGVFRDILEQARAMRASRAEAARKRGEQLVQAVQIAVSSRGDAWTASGFRASFFKRLRVLRDAGLVQPGCTFHGLRHTIGAAARDDGQSDSRVAAAIGDRSTAMAAVYGRDADRATAQTEVLGLVQKRFENIDWKRSAQ